MATENMKDIIEDILHHALALMSGAPCEWGPIIRLMRAAPKLLEACKEAHKHLPGFDVLGYAIAEAKGERP